MEKEPRSKFSDKSGTEGEEKSREERIKEQIKKEFEAVSEKERALLISAYIAIRKKIKEKGIPENVVEKTMEELKEKGSKSEGEELHKEAESFIEQSLTWVLADMQAGRFTLEEAKNLKEIELTDEEYQEMIDEIFGE